MSEREIIWSKEKLLLRTIYVGLCVAAIFLCKAILDQIPLRTDALSVLLLVISSYVLFKRSPKQSAHRINNVYLGLNISIEM